MRIVALDQSTTAVGVCLFNNDILEKYFLIKPKKKKRITELMVQNDKENHIYYLEMPEEMYAITLLRITEIVDFLEQFIVDIKPDVVYFEEIFENGNPKGYKSLARLQGFVAHLCHKLNIPYRIVEESKWIKSWGTYDRTIKRPERKADIMKKVNDLYGLNITVDDLSDSIGIGKYATENEKEK